MREHKILLVDDTPSILKALKRTFKEEGYQIFSAGSADEALSILDHENIDVIISDENMPGTSGTEFFAKVKNLYPDVLRMMLTAMTDIEVAKEAINKGEVYRFFNKPWNDFELLVSVRHALQQKEMELENRHLKECVQQQGDVLSRLEKDHPGITELQRTEDGAIVLDEEI
ncbi:MAG: response regulator [candidate division Zixibacteria bacterium]|jgi:DNA-binding NtrC family response regulator|nr:response regulator [candidate division Zixibacteria bacterium]